MKRFFAVLSIVVFILVLSGCAFIPYYGNAVLKVGGSWVDDGEITASITAEETRMLKKYLFFSETMAEVRCGFDEEACIVFGDYVFAVALDECPSAWLVGTDYYYGMTREAREYMEALFEKYVGFYPTHNNRKQ